MSPLLALFASRLLLEALTMYKDLLTEILNACKLTIWNPFGANNGLNGQLDDVNYADIIPADITQTEPEQKIC